MSAVDLSPCAIQHLNFLGVQAGSCLIKPKGQLCKGQQIIQHCGTLPVAGVKVKNGDGWQEESLTGQPLQQGLNSAIGQCIASCMRSRNGLRRACLCVSHVRHRLFSNAMSQLTVRHMCGLQQAIEVPVVMHV